MVLSVKLVQSRVHMVADFRLSAELALQNSYFGATLGSLCDQSMDFEAKDHIAKSKTEER